MGSRPISHLWDGPGMIRNRWVGDWELIRLIDYTDPDEGYAHIYRHPDGREAVVGSGGYCSDPDLGWILNQYQRSMKRRARINGALSIALNAPWLLVVSQGLGGFGGSALLSITGYGLCCLAAFGIWNALLLGPVHRGWKGRLQMVIACLPILGIGSLLIGSGPFAAVSLFQQRIPLRSLSLFLGLGGSLKQLWSESLDRAWGQSPSIRSLISF